MIRLYAPLFALAGLLAACSAPTRFMATDAEVVLADRSIEAPDPALPGPLKVRTLYYGSGTDKNRPEFRDSVAVRTDSVDASDLVSLGDAAKSRTKYWGFGADAFPINGRVWYPEGPGPYPLVLIVHGNHNPEDYSDPGYGYLGEHLASHGYVFASVDMNFINGGLREENDARGWLLLKHLEAWRGFVNDQEGPLAGTADLDRVTLIGHSRGGEAVGHAAAFNRLNRYPDNANVAFDFGFGIRSIIAIAPVDGQYLPTGRRVPVQDVSYLVFHGSHDGDVTSFHGLRQYHRVTFPSGGDRFKAAIYMYRANHGQWNTVWNNKDRGPRSGRSLRIGDLVPAEDQRRFALVYITAFLDATLLGNDRYRPLFIDHRSAGDWLPPTMYVSRFEDASFRPIADFEEDIDVTSGSIPGVTLSGDSLDTWKEDALTLRSRNRSNTSNAQESQAVWLGWERDSLNTRPAYHIRWDEPTGEALDLDGLSSLNLLLAPEDIDGDSTAVPGALLDLTVQVTDADGRVAGVLLSRYGPIRKPLDIQILRRNLDTDRFAKTSELVLQGFSIPLADFVDASSEINLTGLRTISLVFDQTAKGEVVVDAIGFSGPVGANGAVGGSGATGARDLR